MNSPAIDRYLSNLYYDSSHPASFSGADKLYRAVRSEGRFNISKARIAKWLSSQDPYTLFRNARRRYPRKPILSRHVGYLFEMDLCDWVTLKKYNDGFSYFLQCIDTFSRYIWTRPLKTKTAREIADALEEIFSEVKPPEKIRSDQAAEFKSLLVQKVLKNNNVAYYQTENSETKGSIVERSLKTVRMRLVRIMKHNNDRNWVDHLKSVTESYNQTFHRSIGMSPSEVTSDKEAEIWERLHGPKEPPVRKKSSKSGLKRKIRKTFRYKFKIGAKVRLSLIRGKFDREYSQRWSYEVFEVAARFHSYQMESYQIKDSQGEMVGGTFYVAELQSVEEPVDKLYEIDKIVKHRFIKRGGRRVKQSLISWRGWPAKFNSWLDSKEIVDIGSEKPSLRGK